MNRDLVVPGKPIDPHLAKKFPVFMRPECSFRYLQEPTVGHCSESAESSLHFKKANLNFRIYPLGKSLVWSSRYSNFVNGSLLEKPQESQTGKRLSILRGNRTFLTVSTRTRHWTFSRTVFIRCAQPHIMVQLHPDETPFSTLVWADSKPYILYSKIACGRSPAEIVGSNPTGGMDICLLWVSCVVR